MMTLLRRTMIIATVAVLATGLGACREEERNRPLSFEKGKYPGQMSAPLTEDQLRALRQRNRNQAVGGL